MPNRASIRTRAPRADYLGGDPVEPGSISGGRLDFDASGLHFRGPRGAELRLPVEGLMGITVSGRAAERRRRRARRGTMRVAGRRGAEPAEWLFAIDRSAATALRRRVDRELTTRGRKPLPFVEELDGFPLEGAARPGQRRRDERSEREPGDSPNLELSIAELGHRLDSAEVGQRSRRRRLLPWIMLATVLVAAEVIVPLLLLRGG